LRDPNFLTMPHLREHGYESGYGDASVGRPEAHALDRDQVRDRETPARDAQRLALRPPARRPTCRGPLSRNSFA